MPVIESTGTIPGTLGSPLRNAGTPTNDVTFVGRAVVGTQCIDITNGVLYVATVATATTVTWTKVGAQ